MNHETIHHQFLYYAAAEHYLAHVHVCNHYGHGASSLRNGLRYVTDADAYARRWGTIH